MVDVKKRYGEVTRIAKRGQKVAAQGVDVGPRTQGHAEERRIFSTFKKRAREDYRTLNSSAESVSTRR
jgi:hypothetical protein